MFRLFTGALMLGLVTLTWAARPVTPVKKAPAKTQSGAKTTTAPKKTTTAAKKSASKSAPVRRTAAWRNRQMAPTPERYRQIQESLSAKGYLRPEDANGVWNQTSMDALKKFQMEQNLESTGKINSLSLIALGLGPKHEAMASKPQSAVPAPPAPGP